MSDTPNPDTPAPEVPQPTEFNGPSTSGGNNGTKTIYLGGTGSGGGNRAPLSGEGEFELSAPSPPESAPQPERDPTIALDLGGRYLVGGEIGRGGVGVVLQVWDNQLERPVAVKVLLQQHKNKPEVVRRFLEEARITSRLQHPGVVPIHELGVSPDERPYFVMQLVTGQTLEQILRGRDEASADLPRLLIIFLQVCQTIAHAHSQGVIHRDLKPGNIMVGAFGVVKVMDWGLAKVLGEPDLPDALAAARAAAELRSRCRPNSTTPDDFALPGTKVGTVFGTPAYLPPEQARGEIDQVDKRADVFGLGSILCELLTGHPPYTGVNGREIYRKAAAGDIADTVSRLNTCPVPLDLVSLAKWCLEPNHLDRPADARDVVEVLTCYLQSDQRRAERALVRFFDLSLEMFCIAGTDGYFHRVNENFPRLLGYSATELTSRPLIDFVHPDDREKTIEEIVRLSAGEPCVQFLNRYRHTRGHYLWVEWSAQSVPEERAIYAVARDVTARVAQAEAHRRAEEARLHLVEVVNSADVAIISTTLDGIVQSWNPSAERLFGYRADEIVGKSAVLLAPSDREGDQDEILERLQHSDRVEHHESLRRRKDGSLITVSLTISPVKDEAGNIIGASKIARDISARKKTEADFRNSVAHLRAVIETADEAIITIDSEGTIESLNRSAEKVFGYTRAELHGRNISLLMPSPEREQQGDLVDYFRTGSQNVIGKVRELLGRRKDETLFPIELSVGEICLADRRLFTGVVRDITARKQSELLATERVRVATFLAATGASLTQSVGHCESLQSFTELVVQHLDIASARVWTLSHPNGVLELKASAGMDTHRDGPDSRVSLGESTIGQIAQERKPYLTNAVIGDSRLSDQTWAIREGTVAFAGHPLLVGDHVVGVMAVFARHPLSSSIHEALHLVSNILALSIRGYQLEEVIRGAQAAPPVTG